MYIIKTFQGEVKADFDELEVIAKAHPDALVWLRNGCVRPKYISTIIVDTEAQSEVLKLVGETDEDVQRKIKEYKSEDLFQHMRGGATLGAGSDNLKLGHG